MNKNLALSVAGIVFSIVALMHILRIIFGLNILVGETVIPMWASWIALIISLLLAIWMFRARKY